MRNLTDIYVRLSDEDRDKRCAIDESESIQNQKSMLINYCIEQGWKIHNIYCDEDYSGADRNRPAFNQMLKDCEEGKVDIVLCKTQSRFSRDMEMIEKYIHGKFLEWNVRFVSIIDHADTNVAGNKKARQINGLINEWYLEDLSDNIRRTLHHKKIKGEYCCPYAPYGYKLNPEDKHKFIIDQPAAEVVKSIFEMYKQGMGYIRIAKALNEKQILPPGVYKELQGLNYRNPNAENVSSRQWRDSTIYYILRQEVYTGAIVQGKTTNISYKNKKRIKLPRSEWIVVPNMHEPIIDEELWNAVQDRLKNRQGNDKQFKSNTYEINPLRGIVFCKECGSGMWRMSYQCSKQRYKYYRCRTVKNSAGVCNNTHSIRQIDLEDLILKELHKMSETYFDENEIKLQKKRDSQNRLSTLQEEKRQIENKIATFTGGRAAEEVVFNQITTGASNDIEQATKLARAMITRYGMSDEFDMVALETVTNQYLGGDASLACSADTQKEIDRQVTELVKKQHQKAKKLLLDNRDKLDELSNYLYEKETITGEEFMEILNRDSNTASGGELK